VFHILQGLKDTTDSPANMAAPVTSAFLFAYMTPWTYGTPNQCNRE